MPVRRRPRGTVCAWQTVPDATRDGADEPGYDWLYGTRASGVGGRRLRPDGRRRRDPGAARAAAASDEAPAVAGSPRDPEPTQMLPTVPRPAGRAPALRRPYQTAARRARGTAAAPAGPAAAVAPSRAPPPSGPSRRPRAGSGSGWLKSCCVLWLVFLVAVPLLAWSQDRQGRRDPERAAARPSSPGRRTCWSAATAARG